MLLKEYLRGIIATKIRPLLIKDHCEICGSTEELELHHVYPFKKMFDDTLEELNLPLKEVEEYTDLELKNIQEKFLGKHLYYSYITACWKCHHLDLHSSFIAKNREEAEQQFISYMLENWINIPIYTKEQKQEIVNYAHSIGLKYTKNNNRHTFNSLIRLLEKEIGIEFIFSGESVKITNKIVKKYIPNENKKNIRPYLFTYVTDTDVENYLNSLIGKRLHKDRQEEIKEKLNCRQVNKINNIIKEYGLTIKSKQVREGKDILQIWIILKN